MKACFWLAAILLVLAGSALAATEDDDPWISIPAGAKSSYMGIHGGTIPVSLLVSRDGSSLFTFVGRTGNDFMEVLRQANGPLPTFGNSTRLPVPRLKTPTGLFAGNATESVPVFSLPGDVFLRPGVAQYLQPFGLSDSPVSIEGEVLKPSLFPVPRPFRLLRLPDYFQPLRGRQAGPAAGVTQTGKGQER